MTDEPLGAAAPEPVADSPAPEPNSGDAIERAFRATGLMDDDGGDEAPEPVSEGPARGPDGKFAAKAPEAPEAEKAPETPAVEAPKPAPDVPSRFSPDAKAEWDKTPAPVRAEVNRALREMEGGIERYRQQMEPLKPFQELAERSGTTVHAALERYVTLEQTLAKDPIRGLQEVCRNLGTSLEDVAAHIMGKPAPQRGQSDGLVAQLQQEIAALKHQVGGVTETVTAQRQREQLDQINQFAAQPGRERFNELSETMAQLITGKIATDLADAYEKASRLIPAPVTAPPPPAPDVAAQTRAKAQLSVQGAPGSGSNPASRQRSASSDEALKRAFAQVGL